MTVDPSKVDVGITGAVSKGPLGTAAPTTAIVALDAAFKDAGAISEDGITLSLPDGGDSTPIKAWQNGQTVRTLRMTSDDLPSLTFTFLETNKTSVETYFGTSVTQSAAEGTFTYTVGLAPMAAYVLDVIDGAKSKRFHIPRGARAEVGDLVFKNDEAIGYEVTIEAELDPVLGYNFKGWDTGLKTP